MPTLLDLLSGDQDQEDMIPDTSSLSSRIQQLLGAREPVQPGLAGNALAGRFNTGYGDYAQGVVQSALGKPTLGGQVTDSRINDQLKQLSAATEMQKNLAQAGLYSKGGTGTNGATMQIVTALMNANPGMTFDQALYQYQTGNRQGTQLTPGGIQPTPGALSTLKQTEKTKKQGSDQGEITTQAQADLPKIIDNAQTSIDVINEALNHPGLEANFGMTGIIPNRPGSPASDAAALLEQIKGGGFLTAYGQLRGGGQISNVEGDKATQAYVRMQKAQSVNAFKQAAKEYIGIIQKGVERAKNTASGAVFDSPPSPPVNLIGGSQPDGNDILPPTADEIAEYKRLKGIQ